MPDPAPAAFRELVLSRSASLHRTALLLGRDQGEATELLEEALARASRSWTRSEGQPEAYCRSLLARAATSWARRRRHTDGVPTGQLGTPAETLRGLPPRQRAVLVLRHYHHYTPEQTAEALSLTVSRVEAEHAAALGALGGRDPSGLLDAIADACTAPDAVALLAGSQRRAQQTVRRRRTAGAVVAAVAVCAVGAGALLDDSAETQDLNGVDLAVPDPGYTDGYGLAGGIPQPYTIEGLRLLTSHEVSPGSQWSTGVSPSEPHTSLYAVAWCVPGADAAGSDGSPVVLSTGDQAVLSLPCTAPTDQQSVAAEPLPVDATLWQFDNVMQTRSAVVAVYEEAAWEDFPFAEPGHRMEWHSPPPSEGSVVIDATSPSQPRPDLESVSGTTSAYSVRLPMGTTTQSDVDVILDGPGQLLVAVDGVVLSDDGDRRPPSTGLGGGAWEAAVPDLRDGFVHNFEPGVRRRTFSVNGDSLADLGVDLADGEVEVSVVPRAVRSADWAVEITTSDVAPAAETVLEPLLSDTSPAYAFGLRQIGTVDVPADGRTRQVAVDPQGGGPLVWVPECPDQTGERWLVLTLGATEHGSCAFGDPWSDVARSASDEADPPPPGRPTIAVDSVLPVKSVRVTAYEPVPWEDYPFESSFLAPDVPGPREPGRSTSSGNDGLGDGYVETDVVTLTDLDEQGQAVLQLGTAEFTHLMVRTTGAGRFRLDATDGSERVTVGLPDLGSLPYGELLERDGWWSSWTAEPSSWQVPAVSRESGRAIQELAGEITVTVEGYQDGTLEIAALSMLPATDK